MFQLLFLSALCYSFLQAADHVVVPFKTPISNLDTKTECAAGVVCGASLALGVVTEKFPIVYLSVCFVSLARAVHAKDEAEKFCFNYKRVGIDIAQKFAGERNIPTEVEAFSSAYERLRFKLQENFDVDAEENVCEDILKNILMIKPADELLKSYRLRVEHNRLYREWQINCVQAAFARGFLLGAIFGPVALRFISKN